MIESIILYLLLGAVAGLISGLFGLGGGIIIVPTLAWILKSQEVPPALIMHIAIATSLATIIPTSLVSTFAHNRRKTICWDTVRQLSPGILLGSIIGAYSTALISTEILKYFFALFMLLISGQLYFYLQPGAGTKTILTHRKGAAGLLIGLLSAILGIGGGSITVPYLIYSKVSAKSAVSISSACGFPIAISGSLTYIILGWDIQLLPESSLGFIYLPALLGIISTSVLTAPIGVKLAHLLPRQALQKGFAILLSLASLKMLYSL